MGTATAGVAGAISGRNALRRNIDYIKIESLKERTEPFFIGHFTTSPTKQGGRENPDGGDNYMYVFDVIDTDGTMLGTSATGTLGLMSDIDLLIADGAAVTGTNAATAMQAIYGPFTVVKQGKSFRFSPAD